MYYEIKIMCTRFLKNVTDIQTQFECIHGKQLIR